MKELKLALEHSTIYMYVVYLTWKFLRKVNVFLGTTILDSNCIMNADDTSGRPAAKKLFI